MDTLDSTSFDVTAVVLAGGMSRRLGRDKAVEPFYGEPMILRVIRRMRQVASEVVVVVNDEARIGELTLPDDVTPIVDVYSGMGSLGGIYSGLGAATTEWSVLCACDMPFVSPNLYAAMLLERCGSDAVVPLVDGRPEPIHAAYSQRCIEPIRARILADELKIAGFFSDVSVRYFEENEVRAIDPALLSFFNVNTQADLDTAFRLATSTAIA